MPKTLKDKLAEAMGSEIHVSFIPLNNPKVERTGRLFARLFGPSNTRRGNPLSPAGGNYYQCLHVETVINNASGEVDHVRCSEDSKVGFLCVKHDSKVFRKARYVAGVRDYYAEHVDSIIKHEQRAIAKRPVTFIRTSCMGQGLTIWWQSDSEKQAWLDARVAMREDSLQTFLKELEAEEALADTYDALGSVEA